MKHILIQITETDLNLKCVNKKVKTSYNNEHMDKKGFS